MRRTRLTGSIIGAFFAMVWTVVAALSLNGIARIMLVIAGIVISLALIAAAVRARKAVATFDQGSQNALFKQRSYRLITAVEVVAIALGSVVFNHRTHNQGLIAVWVAFVVGVHFMALAYFSAVPYFYGIGAALVAIGIVAWLGYLTASWSETTITLAAALPSAAVLYFSSWHGINSAKDKATHLT